ncbi:MAG: CopG family transcriptional regulator [Anaerolineales bacterium]|nr:CopG family transcriptional regulator [Chloroflexota bacterium]MBL7161329.1 CopG family transcriptional regulator [Anaerolineales bacterium]
MIRTQIQLTEEQHKFLREKAAEYNVSMAELVRRGVNLLAQQQPKPDRAELIRRAKALAGIATDIDGATDVSINHDKYLAEIYAEVGGDGNDLD